MAGLLKVTGVTNASVKSSKKYVLFPPGFGPRDPIGTGIGDRQNVDFPQVFVDRKNNNRTLRRWNSA